jgi:hypothetical protein
MPVMVDQVAGATAPGVGLVSGDPVGVQIFFAGPQSGEPHRRCHLRDRVMGGTLVIRCRRVEIRKTRRNHFVV